MSHPCSLTKEEEVKDFDKRTGSALMAGKCQYTLWLYSSRSHNIKCLCCFLHFINKYFMRFATPNDLPNLSKR